MAEPNSQTPHFMSEPERTVAFCDLINKQQAPILTDAVNKQKPGDGADAHLMTKAHMGSQGADIGLSCVPPPLTLQWSE